jgi:hypothetical protein
MGGVVGMSDFARQVAMVRSSGEASDFAEPGSRGSIIGQRLRRTSRLCRRVGVVGMSDFARQVAMVRSSGEASDFAEPGSRGSIIGQGLRGTSRRCLRHRLSAIDVLTRVGSRWTA